MVGSNSAEDQALSAQRSQANFRAAWKAAASVNDPELPCVTVEDLGILRDVSVAGDTATVTLTPTYSGCPAVEVIEQQVADAVRAAGFIPRIERVLSPAWTSDWISETGRRKLREYGIAPPDCAASNAVITFFSQSPARCPRCNSEDTQRISEFGSTACKAQYRCCNCHEPFDYFKPL